MLSAAHVLAMDAKNLLDVVDNIRRRHPRVDWIALFDGNRSAEGPVRSSSPPRGTPPADAVDELPGDRPRVALAHSNRVSALIQNYNLYGSADRSQRAEAQAADSPAYSLSKKTVSQSEE